MKEAEKKRQKRAETIEKRLKKAYGKRKKNDTFHASVCVWDDDEGRGEVLSIVLEGPTERILKLLRLK